MMDRFRGIFIPQSYQVTSFKDPIEAPGIYREAFACIDFAMLDIRMLGMSGEEL
jgi:hypothetical protein